MITEPSPRTMPDVARDTQFMLRVSADELTRWRAAAADAGLSLAEWIRRRCNGRVVEPARVIEVPPAASEAAAKKRRVRKAVRS